MAARPRRTAQSMYEDFKPTSRWQEDDESHILTVHLPGFAREQIRVSTEGHDTIRVLGERLVPQNRSRRRFREDFKAPANGDMDRVRAKFEGESLRVTVPKKNIDKPQEPAKASGAEIPKQPIAQPGKDEHQKRPSAVEASQPRDEDTVKPTRTDPGLKQDHPQPDAQRDGRRGTPFRDAGRVLPRDYKINELAGKHATEENSKISEKLPEAGAANKAKLKTGDTSSRKENNEQSEGKSKGHTDRADTRVPAVENKKAVKEPTVVNEERQLLVNMGVAMLVIMALSAYVTYQFTSDNDKN